MKDVVFLVIDSWMKDHVFNTKHGLPLTPFLDSIRNECIFATNVYAQGPFTEAGTKGLLTGRDTLDEEGYFLRYHKAKTFITNVFKDAGFETYSLIYPTCLYSDWIFEKLDHILYTSGMLFHVFWEQKLIHYVQFYQTGKFDQRDMRDCIELFDVIFTGWLHFLNPDFPDNKILLQRFDTEYDYAGNYAIIRREMDKLQADPEGYVRSYLTTAPDHPVHGVKAEFTANFICHEAINAAFAEHEGFQRLLSRKQFWANFRNNPLTGHNIGSMIKRIGKGEGVYTFGEAVYWGKTLTRGKDFKRYKYGNAYKDIASGRTQIEYIADILCQPHSKPIFATAHVEEPHYFTTFFSFDSNDKDLISQELDYAEEYVQSLDSGYRGLITYDLAIRYIDKQIEELVHKLEESGRLENTIICLTADHGSSYNCYPYRKRIVNNCHTENFHIPFIIFEKGKKGRTIDYMATSKDVIPTVLDYIGKPIPKEMKGKSLLSSKWDKDYAMTEYMGPGCPDMRRNKACITIRDTHYIIAYEGFLQHPFSEEHVTEIYDLHEDPLETRNIATTRNPDIQRMIHVLHRRFDEIVENNREWLSCELPE